MLVVKNENIFRTEPFFSFAWSVRIEPGMQTEHNKGFKSSVGHYCTLACGEGVDVLTKILGTLRCPVAA